MLAIHTVLAARFAPELALEKSEAHELAAVFARVSSHYPRVSAIITSKIADHIALFAVVGQVYGTRIAAIQIRVAGEKAKATNPSGPIITIVPGDHARV